MLVNDLETTWNLGSGEISLNRKFSEFIIPPNTSSQPKICSDTQISLFRLMHLALNHSKQLQSRCMVTRVHVVLFEPGPHVLG